jgi:cytoskeletal protein RodZ
LGEWLKQRREQLNISLEKAETETRIRAPYLRALESEDLEALPNPVVARGFLRNYASYLGLDAREAVSRYTGLAVPEDTPPAADHPVPVAVDMFRPVPLHNLPSQRRPRRAVTYGLILIPVVLALLLAWGWWNYAWISSTLSQLFAADPTATLPAVGPATATLTPTTVAAATKAPAASAEPAVATPQRTATPATSARPTRTPSPSPTRGSPVYTGVFVELYFLDKSWLQVAADGVRQFQGELLAGERRSWYGKNSVELRIGNAGGVQVTVNGQNLGTLGAVGEVVDRVFETAGTSLTTTPAVTPTVQRTPTRTATPRRTAPPPSPTAAVTPTP